MEMTTERVKKGGTITIPRKILEGAGIMEGDEIFLHREGRKLVIEPAIKRKRLFLNSDIVDKLVEQEDKFEPEVE
jgi:bifunctional DNA-binding transcriptional regulator/antitoxin component of YhaV-PrlF toxin-antitoxin module